MIEARLYEQGVEGHRALSLDELSSWRDRTDTLLFVSLDDPDDPSLERVIADLRVEEFVAEDLRHGHQRTKLERYGDQFHVAVHSCMLVDTHLSQRELDVVFGPGWVLSVRQPVTGNGATDAHEGAHEYFTRFERQRVERGATDEGMAVWAMFDVIVDRYFDVTEAVDERLDDIEDLIFENRGSEEIPKEVFQLRRALARFRHAASPLREVVSQLLRREAEFVGEVALTHLQDVYDHILRVADLIENQRELLTGLLEAHLAIVSNNMNRVMKATSSWGAILIASTLVAGIYGMNFRYLPELRWRYGYFIALGMMAVLTVVLWRLFKRKNWI